MRIPFLDLAAQTERVFEKFLSEARKLVAANAFVGGRPVEDFEKAFASYCRTGHCVGLNSGTDALRLALLAGGLSPGQEVITSPFTFIATAEAITQAGGSPVFADIDPASFTLDPASVAAAVTVRTFALQPVHIFGLPADLPALEKIARAKGLKVFEDACQAHGAEISGRPVGSSGNPTSFSFYPSKNLGAFGDAGALTCSDPEIARRVRLLRNHGQTGPYLHEEEGYNSRLDALQAALLRLKLGYLDSWNRERRELAGIYAGELEPVSEVRLQRVPDGFTPVYHVLAILAERRDDLQRYLAEKGVESKIIYPVPIHLMPAYAHLGYRKGELPVVESVCSRTLSLPLYPGLGEGKAAEVAGLIKSFYAR